MRDGAAGPQLGEHERREVPAVLLDRLAERRRNSTHAVEEDGVVPLQELALRAHLQGVVGGLETSAVPFLGDLGQRPPDLLVGPAKDEVADFQRVTGPAGDDTVLLDDVLRCRGEEAAGGREEKDETERWDQAREAM